MGKWTSTRIWRPLLAITLTASVLFGPSAQAAGSLLCHQVFWDQVQVPEPLPRKQGFFNELIAKFKRPLKSTYIDPQVEIRMFQKRGLHAEANAKIEALAHALRTNEIVKLRPIGAGQSGARLATFADGTFAVVKAEKKYYQNPGAEVAAYKLNMFFDDFVGVPVTVLRELDGRTVSVQAHLYDAGEAYTTELPRVYMQNLLFFDYLIDNPDRRSANLLFDSKGYLSAIDNGIAFRSGVALEQDPDGPFTNATLSTAWSMRFHQTLRKDSFSREIDTKKAKEWILSWLPPRKVYDKLKSTPDEVFIELLEPYVGLLDAQAFVKRKHFLIQVVEESLADGRHYPRYGDY